MFSDASDLQHHTPHDLFPPAVRQPYQGEPLSHFTFDPSLREKVLAIADAASRVQSLLKECAAAAFDRSIEKELRILAQSLPESAARRYFLAPERTLRELSSVVALVDGASRERLVGGVLSLLNTATLHDDVVTRLDNLCIHLTPEERARVMEKWIESRSPARGVCLEAILRSARSAEELAALVRSGNEVRLLSMGNREIAEVLACASLVDVLRRPFAAIKREDLSGSLERLCADLEQRLRQCGESIYVGTDFVVTVKSALKHTLDRLHSAGDAGLTENQLYERLTVLREIAELEGRYCISLTESGGATWRASTLSDLTEVLRRLPESVVLHTPLLYEVRMNGALPQAYYGVRYGNGVVEVAPHTAVSVELSLAYDGVRPLQVVLAHEIGHGIQLGRYAYAKGFLSDPSALGSCGDPRYDFGDYVTLSGWQLVTAQTLALGEGGKSIFIDGVEFPLGSSVEYQGQRVVFSVNQGRLYAFRAEAHFSRDPYSRSDPWEDWAEAFSEYLMLPERLAKDAPGKFLFFEHEFGRYGMESIEAQIALKGANSAYTSGPEARSRRQ